MCTDIGEFPRLGGFDFQLAPDFPDHLANFLWQVTSGVFADDLAGPANPPTSTCSSHLYTQAEIASLR